MRDGSPGNTVRFVLILTAGLLFLAPGSRVAAQATRADSAAILLDAANRLERDGRADAARDLYEMILARFEGTAAAEAARDVLGRSAGDRSSPGGRIELRVWSTLYGLWLGVAIPAAFGSDEPEAYGAGLLVGGPVGLLSGIVLTRSREFSVGQARAVTFGGTWGTWQGFGWASVFDWGEDLECELDLCVSDGGPEEKFAAMIIGGLTGIGVGFALSDRTITDGMATSVSLGSLWGTWLGFSIGYLIDLRDDDVLAATLIGGNAGLAGGALLASRWGISRGRARMISIAGVLGGLIGGGIDLIAQPDDTDTAIAIPLVGSLAGLAVGAAATGNMDGPPARGGGGGFDGGPLLRFDGGEWSLGVPDPTLVLMPAAGDGRRIRRPAVGLTILRASF